jgi:hypothetical protein
MTEEKQMSDKESLELITLMINKAKNRFSENGFLYLLWGWVILICCLVQFSLLYFFNYDDAYYIWYLTWIAVIVYWFYRNKKKKTRAIRTYTDEISGFVWLVFIICTALLVFILINAGAVNYINPAILVMYGMPTFLSGIILKFRPLIIGGILCWLLSLLSLLTEYDFQLLVIAIAVIAAWLIPGYLLQKKYKKEN